MSESPRPPLRPHDALGGQLPADLAQYPIRLAEALLFRSPVPLSEATLSHALGPDVDVAAVLTVIAARTVERGFELVEVAGGWMFRTAVDLGPALQAADPMPTRRLPRAVLEVLLLIAARQPVTRPEIEATRDVALPQATLDVLQEQGLIRTIGRAPVPGRPRLWATTEGFLQTFGFTSLADLDPLLRRLQGDG